MGKVTMCKALGGEGGGKSPINQRVIGLDLIRISLAVLIFMFHSHIHVLKCDYGILNGFVSMGAIAMTGFFLLSGYAINLSSGSKDMSDNKELKRFYTKRLISILPLYYIWALIIIVTNIVAKGIPALWEELILFPVETLGIQSVFSTLFPYSHNGGSWFISCILICYFFYPLINLLTKQIDDQRRLMLIIILSAILLYSPFVQKYFHLQTIYSNPFFRVLEFSIGVLVCQMNMKEDSKCKIILFLRKPAICILTIITLLIGVSVAFYIGIPADFMLYNWIALPCFISLLVSLGYLEFKRLQNSKTIQYLSALSFSIFLSQIIAVWYIIKYAMEYIGCESNIVKILSSAIICFTIANFFHYCVEIPSTKYLKSKFLK